jgi:sucrose-6-phosphate hydrolase SacC (GH32 family)
MSSNSLKPIVRHIPDTPFSAAAWFLPRDSSKVYDHHAKAIGWMDMWESEMPTKADGWCGALTLPRELTLRDDHKLLMNPVEETKHPPDSNSASFII